MKLEFKNIQGFRGVFSYDIEDPITIINSKFNGVGKTTTYDCLRFLCDINQVDKEEREYFLNMEEKDAMFTVVTEDVTHGFALIEGKQPLFFRQYPGEEFETSSENFDGVARDIGILQINSTLINIFSKEVNLFSSSNAKDDYQLVKALTTHEKTEEYLELLNRSEESHRQELSQMRSDKKAVDYQVQSLPFYSFVDELESIVNNPFYEKLEGTLETVRLHLSTLTPVKYVEVDSHCLSEVVRINELLNNTVLAEPINLTTEPLENMSDLVDLLDRIQSVQSTFIETTPLEYMHDVMEILSQLNPSEEKLELDLTTLEKSVELINAFSNLYSTEELQVSAVAPAKVSELCVTLAGMITQINLHNHHRDKAAKERESLDSTRVQCPIREEVYLIGGKCCY